MIRNFLSRLNRREIAKTAVYTAVFVGAFWLLWWWVDPTTGAQRGAVYWAAIGLLAVTVGAYEQFRAGRREPKYIWVFRCKLCDFRAECTEETMVRSMRFVHVLDEHRETVSDDRS